MKLFLLQRYDPDSLNYDDAAGFVIRAETPHAAREIIATEIAVDNFGESMDHLQWPGNEGSEFWRNRDKSTCTELKPEGAAGVILRDFLHG